jgi:hypothetical protein
LSGKKTLVCLIAATLGGGGCSAREETAPDAEPGSTSSHAGSTGEALDPDAPKFHDDVLPIFVEHCLGCHEVGSIAPFALDDYETARGLAEIIEVTTTHRTMPPFNADNSGQCRTFRDARWLSDEQIETIAAWVAGGAQRGDPAAPRPPRPELEVLRGADIRSVFTASDYVPLADASGPFDDHQCFLVDPAVGEAGEYLTGFEVVPGNTGIVHHVVGFIVDPDAVVFAGLTNADIMQSLDDASPDRPGWDCYGAAGDNVIVEGSPITWAPGGGAFNFPEGTGIRFEPGHRLVLQTHYNVREGAGSDQTTVRMSWAEDVEREAVNVLFDAFLVSMLSGSPFEIPPGEESHVFVWDRALTNWDSRFAAWGEVEILGMLPHMHQLGQRMQVRIERGGDGGSECGLYVDRWDFNWQQAFMFEEPIRVRSGDSIKVSCEWNTTGVSDPVLPGFGTANEMCLLGLYAAQVP